MVAPLTTAGVSDEVAQETQMPVGPQMLEDVEEPMPARLATLRDRGTPDQIVMEQHSLTHFPSQPWCKMCVESRGRDSPHREQSKSDAVVHATMVPDSKKMDMPHVVATTDKWVRVLVYSQHTRNQRHELQPVDIRSFDECEETCTTIR